MVALSRLPIPPPQVGFWLIVAGLIVIVTKRYPAVILIFGVIAIVVGAILLICNLGYRPPADCDDDHDDNHGDGPGHQLKPS